MHLNVYSIPLTKGGRGRMCDLNWPRESQIIKHALEKDVEWRWIEDGNLDSEPTKDTLRTLY